MLLTSHAHHTSPTADMSISSLRTWILDSRLWAPVLNSNAFLLLPRFIAKRNQCDGLRDDEMLRRHRTSGDTAKAAGTAIPGNVSIGTSGQISLAKTERCPVRCCLTQCSEPGIKHQSGLCICTLTDIHIWISGLNCKSYRGYRCHGRKDVPHTSSL
jgi:hypothetical protein